MSKEIDCEYTDEIVCPYCGHEHRDSYEYQDADFSVDGNIEDVECSKCEAVFNVSFEWSCTYSSIKKETSNEK